MRDSSAREIITSYGVLKQNLTDSDHRCFANMPTLFAATTWEERFTLKRTMEEFHVNIHTFIETQLQQNYAAVRFEHYEPVESPSLSTFEGTKDEIVTQLHRWTANLDLVNNTDTHTDSLDLFNHAYDVPYSEILIFLQQSIDLILQTQEKLIHASLHKVVLSKPKLFHTIDMLRQFFLCGYGKFVCNLNFSLFDALPEGKESQDSYGGLSIVNRKKWPPSGPELVSALMQILPTGFLDQIFPGDNFSDALGFSLRDMSDAELNQCSLSSLNTLDFIRLSFQPDRSLLSVFSKAALLKYEQIFGFLSRLLRLNAELRYMRASCRFRGDKILDAASQRFLIYASSVMKILSAFFFDCVIESHWQEFRKFVLEVSIPSSGHRVADVRNRHEVFVNDIFEGLYLGSRWAQPAKHIKVIMQTVLRFCKSELTAQNQYQELSNSIKAFKEQLNRAKNTSNLLFQLLEGL